MKQSWKHTRHMNGKCLTFYHAGENIRNVRMKKCWRCDWSSDDGQYRSPHWFPRFPWEDQAFDCVKNKKKGVSTLWYDFRYCFCSCLH